MHESEGRGVHPRVYLLNFPMLLVVEVIFPWPELYKFLLADRHVGSGCSQGGHSPGKVGEFQSGQGKVRKNEKNVRGN